MATTRSEFAGAKKSALYHNLNREDTDNLDSDKEFKDVDISKENDGFNEMEKPSVDFVDHPAYESDNEGDMRVISTAKELVTTIIHAEDDPTINPWTFRMFFIGSCWNLSSRL